jgi:4-amino-4-deoxy-L-arabinose transferase-like glycosyltransferase
MTQPPNAASPTHPRTLIAIVLVVALAALTTLHRLGAADVCGSNEAVEAVFLQQMVEHDALLFPLENGRSPMYKPPLFHWTAVAIDRLTGIKKVTAFNLRLAAALYAIAGVILTIAFASTILGPNGALLAGLILTASYQYLENARIGRVDMTLCFFETLALFVFAWWSAPPCAQGDHHAQGEHPFLISARLADSFARSAAGSASVGKGPGSLEPSSRSTSGSANVDDQGTSSSDVRGPNYLRYLLAVALGLAVLAKGPVGALLPGLAIAIFLAAEGRLNDVRKLATPGPVLLTLALASSWYLACLFGRRYGFLDRQIGSENFGRFFGALGAMAPWYYLKPILLNSPPLSLIVPFAVVSALRTYFIPTAIEGEDTPSQRRPAQNPLSLWMALRMMFLPKMDVPAKPPLESSPPSATPDDLARRASESARCVDIPETSPDVDQVHRLADEVSAVLRPGPQAPRALIAVRLFAIFWVVTVLFFTVAAYKRRAYLLPLWPTAAVTLSWWLMSIAHSRRASFIRAAVAATCAVLIVINFFLLPHNEVRECAGDSIRDAAAQINRIVGPAEPLYLFQFEDEPAPLLFYLDRTAPRIEGKLGDAPPGYVITTAEAWHRLKPQALDLQPVFESSSGRPRLVLLHHGKAYAAR